MSHVLKGKLLPQSLDCLPEEVIAHSSLSPVCKHLSILLSFLHWLEMVVLWPRGPYQEEPSAAVSPPPLRSQVAFHCSEGLGLARGLGET